MFMGVGIWGMKSSLQTGDCLQICLNISQPLNYDPIIHS